MKYDGEPISCTELARELSAEGGKKLNAMMVGRIVSEVCGDDDIEMRGKRKLIKPEGVYKICQHLKKEMHIMETGEPEIVKVRVLPESAPNPRFVFCADIERKCRCTVNIPAYMKRRLDSPGLIFDVERGCENGRYFYTWHDPRQ